VAVEQRLVDQALDERDHGGRARVEGLRQAAVGGGGDVRPLVRAAPAARLAAGARAARRQGGGRCGVRTELVQVPPTEVDRCSPCHASARPVVDSPVGPYFIWLMK